MVNLVTSIEHFNIYDISALSSDKTVTLLNDWTAAANIANIDAIGAESMNFSTQEACQAVANLIDAAPIMEELDIEYQDSERPIKIFITPATSADAADGLIKITDYYDTTDVIVEMATSRTVELDVNYGDIG